MKLSVLLGAGGLLTTDPPRPAPEPPKPTPRDPATVLGETFDQLVREHPESQDKLFLEYFNLLDAVMRENYYDQEERR